jgi:cobyrinic acid a,c-diamide synthase
MPDAPQPERRTSAVVIAGTHSGVGKTSVTLGLIGALARRGLRVQPFKVGPDFIDPLHHRHVSGRPSYNLDGWMLDPDANRLCFSEATAEADVAVIEGVMGLFDGSEGRSDRGSTAEMAKLLGVPVLLVIDAGAMARSAAALIHGFASFDPLLRVEGVILNRVGGRGHAALIEEAVEDGPAIVGAIPETPDLRVPERHLGLHLPHEARLDYADRLADLIAAHVDLEAVLDAAGIGADDAATGAAADAAPGAAPHEAAPPPRSARGPVTEPAPDGVRKTRGASPRAADTVRIGLARDEAFCFYYAENLALLRRAGAELVEFSPLDDALPGDLDGLYIGGGYPELHAAELAANRATVSAVRELADAGKPIFAECGGLMYLGRRLELDGTRHELCGVMPFSTRMPAPLKLAYVEIATTGGLFGAGRAARGHVFHHSELAELDGDVERRFELTTTLGEPLTDGYARGDVLASYAHVHFASSPGLAEAFVDRCRAAAS